MQINSVRRRIQLKLVSAMLAWMLLGLVMLLTGCATPSMPPPQMPAIPPPPVLSESLPTTTYSETWRQKVESWLKSATGTSTTSER